MICFKKKHDIVHGFIYKITKVEQTGRNCEDVWDINFKFKDRFWTLENECNGNRLKKVLQKLFLKQNEIITTYLDILNLNNKKIV